MALAMDQSGSHKATQKWQKLPVNFGIPGADAFLAVTQAKSAYS